MVNIIVLDTGSILRLSYMELPTSKEKVIESLFDLFQIFAPEEVFNEMEEPKRSLQDIWDEIRIAWEKIKNKIKKLDPPEECFNHIINELGFKREKFLTRKRRVPAEFKVIALALYLARAKNRIVFVSTHEQKALSLFNFLCKKEQIGLTVCPFDILVYLHLYKNIDPEDVDSVWRQLRDFPGTPLIFHFREITYSESFWDCILKCHNRICKKKRSSFIGALDAQV